MLLNLQSFVTFSLYCETVRINIGSHRTTWTLISWWYFLRLKQTASFITVHFSLSSYWGSFHLVAKIPREKSNLKLSLFSLKQKPEIWVSMGNFSSSISICLFFVRNFPTVHEKSELIWTRLWLLRVSWKLINCCRHGLKEWSQGGPDGLIFVCKIPEIKMIWISESGESETCV